MGRRAGYKNFDILLNAFSKIKDLNKDLCIICTGPEFSKAEISLFNSYGLINRIFHFGASETDLINLYSYAELFVFPSFYEGFGFPLLEAMACECPVVCSNTSCFPEIAGDAAMFFNPSNVEELSHCIIQLINSSELQKELRAKGLVQKSKFDWDISREKHLELYKTIE